MAARGAKPITKRRAELQHSLQEVTCKLDANQQRLAEAQSRVTELENFVATQSAKRTTLEAELRELALREASELQSLPCNAEQSITELEALLVRTQKKCSKLDT